MNAKNETLPEKEKSESGPRLQICQETKNAKNAETAEGAKVPKTKKMHWKQKRKIM